MGVGFWYVSPMRRAAFSVKRAFLPSAKARFKKCRLFCPVPVLRLRFLYFRKSLSYQQLPEVHNFWSFWRKMKPKSYVNLLSSPAEQIFQKQSAKQRGGKHCGRRILETGDVAAQMQKCGGTGGAVNRQQQRGHGKCQSQQDSFPDYVIRPWEKIRHGQPPFDKRIADAADGFNREIHHFSGNVSAEFDIKYGKVCV